MLEALLDLGGELYLSPNPQEKVALAQAAGGCGKIRSQRRKVKREQEFIRKLMDLEGKSSSEREKTRSRQA